jgi:3-oxoacyl-[acyl-carrier-protein] synthase-3
MDLQRVYLVGSGSFLPGDPVPSSELDRVLGELTEAPAAIQRFVSGAGRRMMESSGVECRHLAVHPETGALTHTFTDLAYEACVKAMDDAGVAPNDIDLLVLALPSYDYSTPPSSAILQEKLGIECCAEMEIHSNCSGVGKSVQVAYDALRTGRYRNALVAYSQLSSVYTRACYFNQAKVTKTNATLRWILADGAAAMVLRGEREGGGEPGEGKHEILGTYVESIGSAKPPAMSAGGAAADLIHPDRQIPEVYAEGTHHLDQDFAAVARLAGPTLLDGLVRFTDALEIDSSSVDHYVVSVPTLQLFEEGLPKFCDRLNIGPDQLKFRSAKCGYCGGAAILIHLDQMARTGELEPGQLAVFHSVESSKWMTAGFAVRW